MLLFDNISAHILGAQVLRDVNLSLPTASTVTIFGRNGAGKTTLLRTLMGLMEPSSGKIHLDGQELTKVAAYLRPGYGIGYAPEDRRIFTSFTVEQNIELPAKVAGLPPKEVKKRLDHIYQILPELKDISRRSGGSVSGGQGKIVALGRALMIGTKLVLLDEPFQGLAPVLAHRYADVLRAVREKNPETTLIITESSPDLLKGFGDTVYQIERGEVSLVSTKDGQQ
jgi:branched-chain amino acid transport system ATP-binding protein